MSAVSLFLALTMGSAWAAGIPKNSVRSKQIKDNAVAAKDVRDGSLGGTEIADGAITGAEVADGTITGAEVDESTLQLPPQGDDAGDGPSPAPADPTPRGPAGGALAGQYPNPSLAPESVSGRELQPDTVEGRHIEAGAIGNADVSQDTLLANNLANASVQSPEIAGSAVGSSEVATDAIDSDEIRDGGLRGDDVGRASGTFLFDTGPVGAGVCVTRTQAAGIPEDVSSDALAMSIGPGLGTSIVAVPTTGGAAGEISLRVCNVGASSQDPGSAAVSWVAFDV
jgi:hypothetical protein